MPPPTPPVSCARRLLTKYDLAETYEATPRTLAMTTTWRLRTSVVLCCSTPVSCAPPRFSRLRALKGAVDGGLDIPHNDKRYVGYDLRTSLWTPRPSSRASRRWLPSTRRRCRRRCVLRPVPISPRAGALSFCFVGEGAAQPAPRTNPRPPLVPFPPNYHRSPRSTRLILSTTPRTTSRSSRTRRVCSTLSARTPRTRRRSEEARRRQVLEAQEAYLRRAQGEPQAKLEAIVVTRQRPSFRVARGGVGSSPARWGCFTAGGATRRVDDDGRTAVAAGG